MIPPESGRKRHAQASSRSMDVPLYSERRGAGGPPIVLLHGLAASGRYWRPVAERLDGAELRLYMVDLLGFGRSPRPEVAYDPEDHLGALSLWRRAAGLEHEPLFLVGHSVGALLALEWAKRDASVEGVVLVSVPIYRDQAEARQRLAGLSLLNRLTLSRPPIARALCQLMCHTRPLWRMLAPLLVPDVPAEVARDAVLHSWRSFSGTLQNCVFGSTISTTELEAFSATLLFLHGSDDRTAPVEDVRALVGRLPQARLIELSGIGHDPPLSDRNRLATELLAFVRLIRHCG